jgi:hypothetical protein
MIKFLTHTIPRTSLHCRHFRASGRHQRPQVRARVAWRDRVHCGLLRDPDLFYVIPFCI